MMDISLKGKEQGMNDDKIVDLYWIRSEDAITETSIKYGKYCYGIAYNILADAEDAEESVNDTYFDAWNTMPPHRPSALSAFLGKLTRRISIDRWRKRSAAKRGGELAAALDELNECVPSHENVEQDVLAADLEKRINTFVNESTHRRAACVSLPVLVSGFYFRDMRAVWLFSK